jgi:hypothetical protein
VCRVANPHKAFRRTLPKRIRRPDRNAISRFVDRKTPRIGHSAVFCAIAMRKTAPRAAERAHDFSVGIFITGSRWFHMMGTQRSGEESAACLCPFTFPSRSSGVLRRRFFALASQKHA